MSKVKVGISEAMDYMGGMGNIRNLLCHVEYFEKKLEKEIAPYKDLDLHIHSKFHNFAAWIRLYTEYICNKALSELHRAEKCPHKINKYKFKEAINKIINITEEIAYSKGISKSEFNRMKKAIKIIIELRHSFQHGGLPNILRETMFEDISKRDVYEMAVAQNYEKIKKIFYSANALIELLPKTTLHIYENSHLELEKKSNK